MEKKIIFITQYCHEIGGIHRLIENMNTYLNGTNFTPIILGVKESRDGNYNSNIGIDTLSFTDNPKEAVSLLKNKANIVCSMQIGAHIYMQRFIKCRKSILLFAGDSKDFGSKQFYKKHLSQMNSKDIYNYSDFIVLGNANYKIMKKKLDKSIVSKLRVANIFIQSEFTDNYDHNGKIIAVTRIDSDKNIPAYLKLVEYFNNGNYLDMYGDGPMLKYFEKCIEKEKLTKKIKLHGYTDRDDIFKNVRAMVLCSETEGMPTVIAEAINNGIPIFCFDSFSSAKDMVPSGIGKVVRSWDYVEMEASIMAYCNRDIEHFKVEAQKYNSNKAFNAWENIINSDSGKIHGNIKRLLKDLLRDI